MRRQLMQEQELRQLYQPQLPHQGVSFGDGASVSSSVAESMTSSFLSMDMSSAQRTVWQRPTDVLEMISVTIPEVLPGRREFSFGLEVLFANFDSRLAHFSRGDVAIRRKCCGS